MLTSIAMKPINLKPGEEVRLPDGSTGIYVETTEFGEYRFVTSGKDQYLFEEDITWTRNKLTKTSPKPDTKQS